MRRNFQVDSIDHIGVLLAAANHVKEYSICWLSRLGRLVFLIVPPAPSPKVFSSPLLQKVFRQQINQENLNELFLSSSIYSKVFLESLTNSFFFLNFLAASPNFPAIAHLFLCLSRYHLTAHITVCMQSLIPFSVSHRIL